ncbi:expressed protein [Dictyostelium purpureum]|uniref:Expressed protein n=1 Tax=Dictyostelium purpureum TaxID=5786 RepID=F0ZZZ3_DICPU|nr:uncharacterized protein DICPUDRAFT_99519 [Dictyostelium purpureum]EGC30481.1 expressed protein [Dictyostelium purpureum]|eukprot:XP_003292983.1 expressed protein [Dictyostelium purpureum]
MIIKFNRNILIRLFIIIFIVYFVNDSNIIKANGDTTPNQQQQQQQQQSKTNNYKPILKFSKNIEVPGDSKKSQLTCIGGTAMGSSEEVLYLTCKSSKLDIYSRDVIWKCHPNAISKNVQLSKLRIECPKPKNYESINFDSLMANLGNEHPCNVEYHLDWVQYSFGKVIGWSVLGLIFFYIILNRNNSLYNAQINNPMSLPREQINPKVFRALGIIVCVVVFLSTLAFLILCLYMFSAPI